MKPKPFSALNHLTVPCAMCCVLLRDGVGSRTVRLRVAAAVSRYHSAGHREAKNARDNIPRAFKDVRGTVTATAETVPPWARAGKHTMVRALMHKCESRCVNRGEPGSQGNFQSTGGSPVSCSKAFARLNCREPKNPLRADIGLGWAASMHGML